MKVAEDKIVHGSTYSTKPDTKQINQFARKYNKYKLAELAVMFKELQAKHDELKKEAALIYHEWNYIRFLLPEVLDELGLTSAKIDGVGRIEQRHEANCKQVDQEALAKWLRGHDHAEMVAETINSSSLKSFCKNQIAEGEELPDGVDFKPYSFGTVVKG